MSFTPDNDACWGYPLSPAGAQSMRAAIPEVTPAMIQAAEAAHRNPGWCFAEIYRAMRLARPLAEGPGV